MSDVVKVFTPDYVMVDRTWLAETEGDLAYQRAKAYDLQRTVQRLASENARLEELVGPVDEVIQRLVEERNALIEDRNAERTAYDNLATSIADAQHQVWKLNQRLNPTGDPGDTA